MSTRTKVEMSKSAANRIFQLPPLNLAMFFFFFFDILNFKESASDDDTGLVGVHKKGGSSERPGKIESITVIGQSPEALLLMAAATVLNKSIMRKTANKILSKASKPNRDAIKISTRSRGKTTGRSMAALVRH
ncbi:hypothetical protein OUZ56_023351 [Daphnia magna]|uniref:Uncharacterized protein n=1 Tax=Daphnia magna TaxID=35525 RepID=A0ABR0AYZ4_9CRUS|nr:hypothetical protein OUZ56_023351 [Daphnia magna]